MTDGPSGYRERFGAWLDETNWDRRLLLLLLVLLLVILGSGLGTFILDLDGDGPTVVNETATPTPTETPTPDGGGVGPSTPGDTDTPEGPDTPEDTDTPDAPSTPEATPTEPPTEVPDGGGGDGGGGTPTPSGDLLFTSSQQMLSESGVVPGEDGTGTTTVESDSDASAELRITDVAIVDSENDITDPESDVDSSPNDGELSENLEVRIALEDEDGNVDYVLGTDSGYVALEDLPARTPSSASPLDPGEEMTVRVEWQLPTSTGNEVQSDGVEFDVTFELRST